MDLIDQRYLDSLFDGSDVKSPAEGSKLCADIDSLAGLHLADASRLLGAVSEAVFAQVAEVPNDLYYILQGFTSDSSKDDESESDYDGDKDDCKKPGLSPLEVASILLGPQSEGSSPELSPKQKRAFSFDSSNDSSPTHWHGVDSSLHRKLEHSVVWALKSKRE